MNGFRLILTKGIVVGASLAALLAAPVAQAEIRDETVAYEHAGVKMQGHLYYDDATTDERPGVLVVHEWWGLNDHAQEEAKRLAGEGYVTLAVDMYGEGKTTEHPNEAMEFAMAARQDPEVTRARFEAGLEQLKAQERTDPDRIAAMGYCFGGAVVLDMARAGLDLDGVVSLHGSLKAMTPAEPGKIKAKILVCHGAADPMNPPELIVEFHEEMATAGADFVFISYGGAQHSFTSRGADARGIPGIAYNEAAHRRSWQAMRDFYREIFAAK